jgi:peptidoglycan/xylan/chitin deacetylase (PgdA/CDA1 family)
MDDQVISHRSPVGRKKLAVIVFVASLIILSLIPVIIIKASGGKGEPPAVVIRIDDIQDFAFKKAQLFLFKESSAIQVPLSLAVIAGMFGEDQDLVGSLKTSIRAGTEITAHAWKHEDLGKLSFSEQRILLAQSRNRLKDLLGVDTKVLTPPMYSTNDDTIAAMKEEGYEIISTFAELREPASILKVISLPATVELSSYSNGIWTMKKCDSVKAEISKSIQKYGFAVIITHPQEFISNEELNEANIEIFDTLLKTLKEKYSLTTLAQLSEKQGLKVEE